jgi:hypothetical protein
MSESEPTESVDAPAARKPWVAPQLIFSTVSKDTAKPYAAVDIGYTTPSGPS